MGNSLLYTYSIHYCTKYDMFIVSEHTISLQPHVSRCILLLLFAS